MPSLKPWAAKLPSRMSRHPLPLLTLAVPPIRLSGSTCLVLQDLHAPFADPERGWLATSARTKVLAREFDEYFDAVRMLPITVPVILSAFRAHRMPVAFSCLGHRSGAAPSALESALGWCWDLDGPDGAFSSVWQPGTDEPVCERPGWGALGSGRFRDFLIASEIEAVVLVGTMFEFGIRQTATELADHGIGTLVISDAVAPLTQAGGTYIAGNMAYGLTKLRTAGELIDLMARLSAEESVLI